MVALVVLLTLALVLTGCSSERDGAGVARTAGVTSTSGAAAARPAPAPAGLAGMPPVLDPDDVYTATRPGRLSPVVRRFPARVYVPSRDEGSISLISFATRKVAGKWRLPGGGSPDMGGVSADGRVLWLSGRYHAEVYAIDTRNGRLLARVPVGSGPHGLCVYPQPGRYSLGHTGVFR